MTQHYNMLAQAVPDAITIGFWCSVAANLAAVVTVGVLIFRKKEQRTVTFQPPDLSGTFDVRPKGRRFSSESCDIKHDNIDRRLDGHDAEISKLWFTMREEDANTRSALAAAVRDFDKTINRVDGTLTALNATTTMIQDKLMS